MNVLQRITWNTKKKAKKKLQRFPFVRRNIEQTTPANALRWDNVKIINRSEPVPEMLDNKSDDVVECNCMSTSDGTCGDKCINRVMQYLCGSVCGPNCTNRPFHELDKPTTHVITTKDRGKGLFLSEAKVCEGKFIAEYVGEIIDNKDGLGDYMIQVETDYIIDARNMGNESRYMNSSCDPNCEAQKWIDTSTNQTRVGLFAKKNIYEGEEITLSYRAGAQSHETGPSAKYGGSI
jgi:hypothetical protein